MAPVSWRSVVSNLLYGALSWRVGGGLGLVFTFYCLGQDLRRMELAEGLSGSLQGETQKQRQLCVMGGD